MRAGEDVLKGREYVHFHQGVLPPYGPRALSSLQARWLGLGQGRGGLGAEWIVFEGPLWEKGEQPLETWLMMEAGWRGRERGFGARGSRRPVPNLSSGWDEDVLPEDRAQDLRSACHFCVGWSNHISVMLCSPAAHSASPPPPTSHRMMSSVTQLLLRTSEQLFFAPLGRLPRLEPHSGDT